MRNAYGDNIRFHGMCRGMGKIYALVDIPSPCNEGKLLVRSATNNGTAVPAVLLPYRDGSFVLVLAVLSVVQTVSITWVRADGVHETLVKRAVHPRAARLTSQVHTALDDQVVKEIRNYDVRPSFGTYGVEFCRVLLEDNGTDTVQGLATCTYDDADVLGADTEVVFITRSGAVASLQECAIARDLTTPVPDTDACLQRTLQFSAHIPRDLQEFVMWVRPKDPMSDAPSGFYAVEAHDIAWWRSMWHVWMKPATNDPRYTERYYLDWAASRAELAVQRRTKLSVSPLFSIIVPLYNTPLPFLDEMIESVLAQSYEKLELILVNASPLNDTLAHRVGEWCEKDKRIHTVLMSKNCGITENTNEGIKAAHGDFLCFLDHDDIITPDALFCYAQALEEYPTTDLFYSDEDHLEEDGSHTWPFFKPDWNPDLLMGMNYVCHFLCVRKSVVDELEPATKEFDGAQDHHLTFRVSERARNIYHCRRVLYHWRVHTGSTAAGIGEKPYAVEAGRLAVQAHLDRCGIKGRAVHSERMENRYEVEYELESEPLVSVLIPNKDAVDMLDRCLRSIREKTDYANYEVIIIENNSTDDATFAYYKKAEQQDEHVRVVYYDGDFNFSKINNFGVKNAKGEYYLLLNNDTEVITPHWMRRLVSVCARKDTGIVGAKLLYPDNTIQHVGVINLPTGPDHVARYMPGDVKRDLVQLAQDFTAVTGACLMVKRSVYEEVEGLDERFAVDYNDVDFCWKVHAAGYLVVCDPSVELYHYESISRGLQKTGMAAVRFEHEKALLRDRWPKHFAFADPASSPNFDDRSLYWRLK